MKKLIKQIKIVIVVFAMMAVANITLAATAGPEVINFDAEVGEAISLVCHETGQADADKLIDFGIITPGTPEFGSSDCDVLTNDNLGYYLTMVNDEGAGETLQNDDATHADITDTLAPLVWRGSGQPTAWTTGTTAGLGFTLIAAPNYDTSQWGTSTTCTDVTNHNFTGAPETAQVIMEYDDYHSTETTTTVCYAVDAPTTQPSDTYSGSVTFSVTSDASGVSSGPAGI